jgi:glycerophosphoryl diester phosphodiesterase
LSLVTLVLAHRGANREAPENTIAAFRRAVELGADGVELDVQRTADGALVVHHDAATPAGVLAEMTLPEIAGAIPSVPRLEEALDVCAGLLVNVEIKNSPRDPAYDPTDRAATLLVELLAARGGADRIMVSSFNLQTVDRVHELAPALPTALLTVGLDPLASVALVTEHGHRALHPDVHSLSGPSGADALAAAHAHGVEVNVWTVNDPDEIRRLAGIGVDAVITDVPDVALSVLALQDRT